MHCSLLHTHCTTVVNHLVINHTLHRFLSTPYPTILQAVERNTLARQCPTLLTLLKAFTTKMELQEPTFKDIVVVYR